uniref:Uncharacterized protein n=1 Tax=Leviviridae sp. TaxID=2027243 RepID=A0A514D7E8_9VIRU|nr:MAG: hypothetical protein H2Rhizo31977e5871_000002 [Leviviridae sp.]
MALPDPLSLTLGGAQSLAKIVDDGLKSQYLTADNLLSEVVSHQVNSKRRTMIRLDQTKVAADPLTAVNKSLVGSVYTVFDFPLWGFSTADKIALFTALNGQLTASTNALLTRIVNGEH